MSEAWVVNASPLITLAKVARLDLLWHAGRTVSVPRAVAREILAGPVDDPAAVALRGPLASHVVDHDALPAVTEWGLGAGETGVISLAIERNARAVLDDREARSAAAALKVPTIGTLGIVLLARVEGRIASAALVLRALRDTGLRLDALLVRSALERVANERWDE